MIEHSLQDVNAKILIDYSEYYRLKNFEQKHHLNKGPETAPSSSTETAKLNQAGAGCPLSSIPTPVVSILPSEVLLHKAVTVTEQPDAPPLRRSQSKKSKKSLEM